MSAKPGTSDAAIRCYKRYPAYKDSGVEWLGEVPSHWQVHRLKTVASVRLSNVDKKSLEGEEEVRLCNYVDVYYNDRIEADFEFMAATATREQVDRFSLRKDDILITKDSESWTDIAVPSVVNADMPDVLCGYHLALIRPDKGHSGRFLARAFSAVGPRDQFQFSANGITRFGLTGDAIRSAVFALPPTHAEQEAIASFLDRETERIDALVAKKERVIRLLNEQRAATLALAVTKGIDPKARTRDSGLDWLGHIPAEWKMLGFGRVVRQIEQGWSPIAEDRIASSGEWAVIKLSAVSNGRFIESEQKALPAELVPDTRFEIQEGDFLLTRANTPELVGDVCVVEQCRNRLMLCDLVYRLHLRKDRVVPRYLSYLLLSLPGRHQIEVEARGASQSMVKISQGLIRRWALPLPSIEEQRTISTFLDHQTKKFDSLVGEVHKAIHALKELRNAMISAAVTGRIDVRGAS